MDKLIKFAEKHNADEQFITWLKSFPPNTSLKEVYDQWNNLHWLTWFTNEAGFDTAELEDACFKRVNQAWKTYINILATLDTSIYLLDQLPDVWQPVVTAARKVYADIEARAINSFKLAAMPFYQVCEALDND